MSLKERFQYFNKEVDDDTYGKSEIASNKSMIDVCFILSIFLSVLFIGFFVYILLMKSNKLWNYIGVYIIFPIAIVLMATTKLYKNSDFVKRYGFKYFLMFQFIIVIATFNILFPKHGIIAWPSLLVVSNHFYSKRFTRFTFVNILVFMLIAIAIGTILGEWDPNLLGTMDTKGYDGHYWVLVSGDWETGKWVEEDLTTVAERIAFLNRRPIRYLQIFLYYYSIRAVLVTLTYFICNGLNKRTHTLLEIESENSKTKERMAYELSLANHIQSAVLPKNFPNNEREELFALMKPAKEVGGDFYDFFHIDENHIALVIGDVSGKGVPASLFMMKAETLIKSIAHAVKISSADILRKANQGLCEGNDLNIFITCWLGILDLSTGKLNYCCAGHNPPLVSRNGKYEYLLGHKNFILAGVPKMKYQEDEITLVPGDSLFMYTDGVTEAHNINNDLYGENRLLNFLNNYNESPYEIVTKVNEDVEKFRGDAPQFDDITIMMFTYRSNEKKSKVFPAKKEELDNVFDFLRNNIVHTDKKAFNSLLIAVEEVFVNVCSYAYENNEGICEISIIEVGNKIGIVFADNGAKFNPLEKEDADITLSADERGIGGLGIYMVKTICDNVNYEYRDGCNILTLIKEIK